MATRLNHSLRAFFGIITALTLCLLVACSSGGSGQAVSANGPGGGNANKAIGPNDTWTVLMYVCGSDLESTSTRMGGGLATGNLVELTQAKLGNNVNYVIETGGAKKWQNDTVSARYLERYEMKDGYMTQVEQVPSASMAESSTLADFLNWGVKKYPADHYMLVIWDHGGGSITVSVHTLRRGRLAHADRDARRDAIVRHEV